MSTLVGRGDDLGFCDEGERGAAFFAEALRTIGTGSAGGAIRRLGAGASGSSGIAGGAKGAAGGGGAAASARP